MQTQFLFMEEIKKLGLEVFGDNDKFNIWLETESQALNNKKPIDLINEPLGLEIIVSLLTRYKHGIFV